MLYIVAKLLTVQFFVFEVPVCQGVFISSGKFASFNLINLFLLLDNLLLYSTLSKNVCFVPETLQFAPCLVVSAQVLIFLYCTFYSS